MEKKYQAIVAIIAYLSGLAIFLGFCYSFAPDYIIPHEEDLKIISVAFPTSSTAVISVTNTGGNTWTVSSITIDDVAMTSVAYGGSFDSSHSLKKGLSGTITIGGWTWTSGSRYTFAILTTSNDKYPYTVTASP